LIAFQRVLDPESSARHQTPLLDAYPTSNCHTCENGNVDADEDVASTAAREVEEETGWRPRERIEARMSGR